MDGLDLEDMISAADDVIRRWADRVDEMEVFLLRQEGRSVSGERDRIVRSSGNAEFGAGVRVVSGGHLGFSYCTDLDGLDGTVERAMALSPLGPEVSDLFPAPRAVPVPGLRDPKVDDLSIDDLQEMSQRMIDRSREIDPDATVTSVGTGTSSETIVLANTAGPPVSYRGTYLSAGLSVLYRTDPPATGFEHMLSRSADLDPEAIADAAMEMARNSRDPVHGEGGLRRVVLRHGALSDILEFTLFPALAGERVAEGRSLLSGRLGESVAASSFTLVDRQDMPSGCGASPFDDEGIPSREIPLIERGVLRGYLHHLTSAAKHGHVSTGSALRCERWSSSRSYRAAPAAIARNVHLVPTVDDAIAEVDRGVYIVNVIGAHTSNPVSGDFSLNINIAFEIRRGEVGRPLRPMMLSGNIADILEGTLAVGSDHHYHTGSMSGMGGYLPSIVVNGLTLTP